MSTLSPLPIVLPNAAGLDIGKEEIVAAVPPDRDPQPVRRFPTFTPDLHALAEWLAACGIESIALESTGIYWIPIFEILEERGFQVFVVNAAHLRRVPGRKTDIQDCQWLQQLHALGLLKGSFRPDAEICALRTLLRHRAQLIQHRAPHILHIQKALHAMNLQLDCVLSDVTGQTGLAILRAIVAGARNPVKLAQLRHPNCHSSSETIAKTLTGNYQPEHLFTLQQSLEFDDFYSGQISRCDAEIERHFSAIKPRFELAEGEEPPTLPVRPVKRDSHSKNQPASQTRQQIVRITGVDLVAVEGISASIAQTILSEIGTDMSRWPTLKHFCA